MKQWKARVRDDDGYVFHIHSDGEVSVAATVTEGPAKSEGRTILVRLDVDSMVEALRSHQDRRAANLDRLRRWAAGESM